MTADLMSSRREMSKREFVFRRFLRALDLSNQGGQKNCTKSELLERFVCVVNYQVDG